MALIGVFLILQIKHFIFDYLLQTPFQFKNKGTYGHPGGVIHAGLQAIGTVAAFAVIPPGWGLGIAIIVGEFIIHYHIDWLKEQTLRRLQLTTNDGWYWRIYGVDQLLHQVTYVAIAAILATQLPTAV